MSTDARVQQSRPTTSLVAVCWKRDSETRLTICKIAFERMLEEPDVLYGEDLGSNYQGQETTLSKHFVEQSAAIAQMRLREVTSPEPTRRLFR